MADQSTGPEGPRWLVEPSSGETVIHVAVGDGTTVSPALRAALEALAGALQREEVIGYARKCDGRLNCTPFDKCNPQLTSPCAAFTTCRIKS